MIYKAIINTGILNGVESDVDKFTKYIKEYLSNEKANDENALTTSREFKNDDIILNRYKWSTASEEFGDFISDFLNLLNCIQNPKSSFYKSEQAWDMIRHVVKTVNAKLPNPPANMKFPWGNNWYQFSISYPRLLVFSTYLYRSHHGQFDQKMKNEAARIINNYIKSPTLSLGWTRGGDNSVMMAVPWCGMLVMQNQLKQKQNEAGYILVKKQITFPEVSYGEGMYKDKGYVFHSNLRAYGYLYGSVNDYIIMMKLEGKMEGVKKIEAVFDVLEHPTINVHFGPLYGRGPKMTSARPGKLGFYHIDSNKVVSIKEKDYLIQFNGQNSLLYGYESDAINFKYAQYWLMAREIYTKYSTGIIDLNILTRLPGVVSKNYGLIELKPPTSGNDTSTTKGYQPTRAICCICKLNKTIAIYNSYKFPNM